MEDWIKKNKIYDLDIDYSLKEINRLNNSIKDIKKKKKDALYNSHMGLFDYLCRKEDSIYNEINYHNENLVRNKLVNINYKTEYFPDKLIVDYHFLRVYEATILGDMLVTDKTHGFKNMVWITGVGKHSKNEIGVLKAKLKDVLIYYNIKYEESKDRLIFTLY